MRALKPSFSCDQKAYGKKQRGERAIVKQEVEDNIISAFKKQMGVLDKMQ